jgi:uncharacterized protein (DUF2132 family)
MVSMDVLVTIVEHLSEIYRWDTKQPSNQLKCFGITDIG